MSTQFEPLKENKKYETIVSQLKQKVFSGEFKHGDRLPTERELAESLKVSRIAVREAYRALQLFGMIDIRRGNQGGAYICSPNSQSIIQSISDHLRFQGIKIEEWTEARLILEVDIAKLAIKRATTDDFKRLEQIIEKTEQKSQSGELVHRENIQFHLCLADIARNKIIYSSYLSMMNLLLSSFLALGVGSEHYKDVAQAHRHLLDVLKQGEEDPFVGEVEKHVKNAGKNLIQIATRSPLFNGNMT